MADPRGTGTKIQNYTS